MVCKPLFYASEAHALGLHPSQLSYYAKTRRIERIARGVYRGIDSRPDTDFQWEDFVVTVKSVPCGVACLLSALAFYELTDEIPRSHWIAIPHSTTAPKRHNARFVRMRDTDTGKTCVKVGNESIVIFNQERTLVDTFRYLDKETAVKALKLSVKASFEKRIDLTKLRIYAKKFRINLDPYIITVTT